MWKLASGKQVLGIDEYVISESGFPSVLLMENAGLAVARVIEETFKGERKSVALVCGPGNNGADGLIVARKLHTLGWEVEVFLTFNGDMKSEEGKLHMRLCKDVYNISVTGEIPSRFNHAVIVDAVLGAGAARRVDYATQKIFDAIHDSPGTVVAVDIPSGICPSSGKLLADRPVKAHTTVTFGLLKSGLVFYPGASYTGTQVLATISYPKCSLIELLNMRLTALPVLKDRDVQGHKGTFGKAFFLAGSEQYYGAPLLSSLSFLKSGGGYARLFCPKNVGSVVASQAPEIVELGNDWSPDVEGLLLESDVVVVGPGIGLSEEAHHNLVHCVNILVGKKQKVRAIIFDGDALTILAKSDFRKTFSDLKNAGIQVIVTPHQGEWYRLFPQQHKLDSEYEFAQKTFEILKQDMSDLIVVAKGARTTTVSREGIWVNKTGNAGMGTCGSGDVLAGVTAGLICNMGSGIEAVAAGVFVHGLAGDLAAGQKGEDGIVSSDIMNQVPVAMKKIRSNSERFELKNRYFPKII
jgi:NAD(P)H-hydrate epimerase